MKHRSLSPDEIEKTIRKCQFCHIGMIDTEGKPYVLAMNFGYSDGVIYFHSAPEGKKIDALRNNPNVCVEFAADCELKFQNEDVACSYSMKFYSVIAHGKVEFIHEDEPKIQALNIIMSTYTTREFTYSPPSVRNVSCWKLMVDRFEGRAFGY